VTVRAIDSRYDLKTPIPSTMETRVHAHGRPAGFIRRNVLRPIELTIIGYFLFGAALAVVTWRFVRVGGYVTPLWQALLAFPAIFVLGLLFHCPLVQSVQAWWDGRTGEMTVASILAPLMSEGYEVLHDLDIGRGNVDHVVIGPTGIFAIETKAWRGRIDLGPGGRLMCKNFDRDGVRRRAQSTAMTLRGLLGANAPYVTAVIALTRTRLPLGPMDLRSTAVVEAETLPSWIRGHRHRLDRNDVERFCNSLIPLTQR